MRSLFPAFLFLFFSIGAKAQFQGLALNEFSQGTSGIREFFEFVVVGTKTCTDSTADIRGWIFDDNNGWYGTGSGKGIAQGHYRFAYHAVWEKVPYGSIILVYNSANKNTNITLSDDPSDTNGDGVYILPIGSAYLEDSPLPSSGSTNASFSYATATYSGNSNSWDNVALANGGDGVVVVSPANQSTAFFSILYGIPPTGVQTPTVTKPAVSSGSNCFLSDGNYTAAASWIVGTAGTAAETPGRPNGGANTTWIESMKFNFPVILANPSTPPVCFSTAAQTTTLPYSTVYYNPTHYAIMWEATPVNNFAPVTAAPLPASPITINIPAGAAPGVYTGHLYVINSKGASCDTLPFSVTVMPPPTVSAGNYGPLCGSSSAITLAGSPAGGLFSGPGVSGNSFTPPGEGSFSIQYNYTDPATGCSNSSSTTIEVHALPAVPAVTVSPAAICPGGSAAVTATALPAGTYDYSWTVPAGATDPGNVASFTATVAGTYTVNISNSNGCSVTATGTLTVNAQATVTADDKQVCAGSSVTLTGSPAGGTWSGTGVSGTQFDAAGLAAGTYTVTYSYTNGTCSGSATATITVVDRPSTPTVTVTNHCNGTSTLEATGYTGTLQWSNGATTPSITVTMAGLYTVSQTVNGCTSAAASLSASPNGAPPQPVIATLQQPDCHTPVASLQLAVPGAGYTFSLDGSDYSNTNGLFTGIAPGSYLVTLRNAAGCVSAPLAVTINPVPSIPASPSAQIIQPTCTSAGSISVQFAGVGLEYSIDGINYQSSLVFPNPAPGTYALTVRNGSGCVSDPAPITIHPATGVITSNTTACIAEGSTYDFNGQTLAASGTYTATFLRPGLCDSLVSLQLVVSRTETESFSGCGSYLYNGTTYTRSLILRDTVASTITACDSLYRVLNITINPVPVTDVSVCLPAGQTHSFNGAILTRSGRYTAVFTTAAGCDSTVHLSLTINEEETTALSGCGSVLYNGTVYTSSTTVTETVLSTLTSCDSITRIVSISVLPSPLITASPDLAICLGQAAQLSATSAAGVSWLGFGAGEELTVSPTANTTYTAVANSGNGCTDTARITVRVSDFNLQLTASTNPAFAGAPVRLLTSGTGPYSVLSWEPAMPNPWASSQYLVTDTSMMVKVIARSEGGCIDEDSLLLVVDPLADIYIPTAFTPNGDGKNDFFTVAGGSFKTFDLKIFNRWGQLVFATQERSRGWDGTLAGKPQASGTFVYVLSATAKDSKAIQRQGTVTLVR